MKKAVIWDLDGTLFDSYDVIVESIETVFQEQGIRMDGDAIRQHALQFSIRSLFRTISEKYAVETEALNQRYAEVSRGKYLQIKAMPGALTVLEQLRLRGVESYVFTHRGKTTIPVLKHLGMEMYFRQILTSESGFQRKPDPEALLYLINKHRLDPADTCYVGDRSLDMECAANAKIDGILYAPVQNATCAAGAETRRVKSLLEILEII